MKKIKEFNDMCEEAYGRQQDNIWDKVICFLEKLSKHYKLDNNRNFAENTSEKKVISSFALVESEEAPKKVIEWNSFVQMKVYLNNSKGKVGCLKRYIMDMKEGKECHRICLEEVEKKYDEMLNQIDEARKQKDKEALEQIKVDCLDKIFSIVKEVFAEEIIEFIYSALRGNNADGKYKDLLIRVNDCLGACGFYAYEIHAGDKVDTKNVSIISTEYTGDSDKHKTVKEVIRPPYAMMYHLNLKGQPRERIIKGQVVCYTNRKTED